MDSILLSIDADGGDNAPYSVLDGIEEYLSSDIGGNVNFVIYTTHDLKIDSSRCKIVKCKNQLLDSCPPLDAIRIEDTSMLRVITDNNSDCVISFGNTGAYMVLARKYLRLNPGVHKPAICAIIPGEKHKIIMLDLGANVSASCDDLLSFAKLGTEFYKSFFKHENPIVGLLNIGTEDIKGTNNIRNASSLIQNECNYYGFIEPSSILDGDVHIVVTDGFTGNMVLKSIEGTASYIMKNVKNLFKGINGSLSFLLIKNRLISMKEKFDARNSNGAICLGLSKIVVKGHGSSDARAVLNAIKLCVDICKSKK